MSSRQSYYTPGIGQKPEKYGIILPIHSQAMHLQGGFVRAPFDPRDITADIVERQGFENIPPQTKDPSGGTTGRVKLYGRLGWMGARAEYSLDGEG